MEGRSRRLQQPLLPEAGVLAVTHDDVIQHADPQELGGMDQSPGHGYIFITGTGVATRMVVHEDHGAR
jgi:hypothetical protein